MFYARLLYPSYYFDVYEEVMNKDRNEEDLVDIIKSVIVMKIFKEAYLEISKYAPIEKNRLAYKLMLITPSSSGTSDLKIQKCHH